MVMKSSCPQSGSVIFYILLAVALLASLSFMVARGSRTSESLLSDQQAKIAAQEIIDYGQALASATSKLRLRGCKDTELDFANPVWTRVNGTVQHDTGHNPNAPATGCSIFAGGSGAAQAVTMPVSYTTGVEPSSGNTQLGHGRIYRAAVPGVGETGKEEIMFVIGRLNLQVCMKINEILGIPNQGNAPPPYVHSGINDYNGAFSDSGALTDSSGSFTGKTAFCVTNGNYDFWQVLVAR